MIIDALLLVSDAQAVTADAKSTNTIDLGNPTVKNRIGTGEPMAFLVSVDVAAAGAGTYQFDIIDSPNADLSAPTILASFVRTAAQLVAGATFVLPIPPGTPTQRYLGLNYDVGGTPTITVTAALMPLVMASVPPTNYAKNYPL